MLANLEQLLLPGAKKVPKIYVLACHPLQPHLVAVGANAGAWLRSCFVLASPPRLLLFCRQMQHHPAMQAFSAAFAGRLVHDFSCHSHAWPIALCPVRSLLCTAPLRQRVKPTRSVLL